MIQHMDESDYYKAFYELAPIGFYATQISDGKFIIANRNCVEILGFSSFEEMTNSIKATDLYSQGVRDKLIAEVKKHGEVSDYAIKLNLLNGNHVWVLLSARLSENGECLEGTVTDITRLRELEEELEKYRTNEACKLNELTDSIQLRIKKYEVSKNGSSH